MPHTCRVDAAILMVATAVQFTSTIDSVYGDPASADAAVGPPKPAPRVVLRGLGRADLYTARNRVETEPLNVEALMQEDAQRHGGPARTGLVQEFPTRWGADGIWTQLQDGGWLWTLSVHAPGARGIRVRIPQWDPPIGAELNIYNAADPTEVRGPITGDFRPQTGVLWTPTIYGDEVRIEYYLPPETDRHNPANQIALDALVNEYAPLGRTEDTSQRGCVTCTGDPALCCHEDVVCHTDWSTEANAVGGLSWVSNNTSLFCSGSMLNRVSAASDLTPLFETATHCGITDSNADSVLITWFYQSATCDGCDAPGVATLPQTLGCTVLVRDEDTDWTLLGLTSSLPSGLTWLGWDSAQLSNDSVVVGIHHPQGSFKRYSEGEKINNNGPRPDFNNFPNCQGGSAYKVDWFTIGGGLTEPGSSGSPLLGYGNSKVYGALSCGDQFSCSGGQPVDQRASYGRLDQAYDLLRPYLNPADPVYVDNSYGGTEEGTAGEPFDTIKEGVFAVIGGSNLFVETGSYVGSLVIDKAMTIHARNGTVIIGD